MHNPTCDGGFAVSWGSHRMTLSKNSQQHLRIRHLCEQQPQSNMAVAVSCAFHKCVSCVAKQFVDASGQHGLQSKACMQDWSRACADVTAGRHCAQAKLKAFSQAGPKAVIRNTEVQLDSLLWTALLQGRFT